MNQLRCCLLILLIFVQIFDFISSTEYIVGDYSYNQVTFDEFSTFTEFAREYLTLGNGFRINQNTLIGIAEPHCMNQLRIPTILASQRFASGSVFRSVILPSRGFPLRLSKPSCSEVLYYRVNSTITEPFGRTTILEPKILSEWIRDILSAHFSFINRFPFDVNFYYHVENSPPVFQGRMKPNMVGNLGSYLGHIFSVRTVPDEESENELGELVDFMVVDGYDYEFRPENRLETCEIAQTNEEGEEGEGEGEGEGRVFEGEFTQGRVACEDMEGRFLEFSHQIWFEKRIGLNFVQSLVVPPLTPEGFLLKDIPPSTFKWLREWYLEQQAQSQEEETSQGPTMNQHLSPSQVAHLPSDLKSRLGEELRPGLQEWFGGDLVLTSVYGIRRYSRGSVLRMHVDTVGTHVISAILNVDQDLGPTTTTTTTTNTTPTNTTPNSESHDWPLLILDHEGDEHNITMKVGEMVYYESARLLHGRIAPFEGLHYDNIFVHFQPTSGWDYQWA